MRKSKGFQLSSLPPKYQQQAIRQGAEGNPSAPIDRLLVSGARQSKWKNIIQRDEYGKKLYDSKHESNVHKNLCLEYGEHNIIQQVSIPIGSKRIRPDFMVILERFGDGSFRGKLFDAKGKPTPEWLAKANHLRDKHGLEIETL